MKKIFVFMGFCAFCLGAVFLDDCKNDCFKEGLKAKPRPPLTAKDKRMFNSVYNEILNQDYSK